MMSLTMGHRAALGVDRPAVAQSQSHARTPAHVDTLRGDAMVSSASLAMMFIVSGPQTHRGTPPPLVGARVVSAALWCMFTVAILDALVF